jgi:ABC-type transport system involved in multi-copper enzyme maturation permease subunit
VRSVFAKEWLQGHMIAIFGLLLGGLIVAFWGLLTATWVKNGDDQGAVNAFCGLLYLIVPLILATFVGSGLIAAEAERGTLPLLLGLPFTRRQVWLGKVLGGLALILSAIVLVILPGAIAAQPALEEVTFWQLLPELALAALLLFCCSLLFSSLSLSIANAFLGALGLSAALVIALIAFTFLAGARLTPYGPIIDIDLWALASCPALLASSYVGFTRGELFRGRRRWLLPIATALLVMLIISIPIIAAARWTTRYDRTEVEQITGTRVTGGGRVATLYTQASSFRPLRSFEKRWIGDRTEYRRTYSVTLDLDTGKELLVLRETDVPVVSPDGTLAAVLPDIRPLTWRGGEDLGLPKQSVEVWDLKTKRVIYRGLPKAFLRDRPPNIEYADWSPDGRWLALLSQDTHAWQPQGGRWRLLAMRPDGSQPQTVELHGGSYDRPTYTWAPDGSTVYSFSAKGNVVRSTLPDGQTKTIWSWRDESTPPMFAGRIAVSPDGNSLAVSLIDDSPTRGSAQPGKFSVFVLSVDGKQSDMIWSDSSDPTLSYDLQSIHWAEDSSAVRVARLVGESQPRHNRVEVITWRRGEDATAESKPPPKGDPHAESSLDLRTLDPTGALTPVTTAALREALSHSSVVGHDHRGRIILRDWDGPPAISAFDPATGELTHIYP